MFQLCTGTTGDFDNEKIMKSKISLVSPNETWMKMYYTLKSIWNTKWKPNDKVMKFFSQCFEYTMKKIQCIFTMTFHCIFIALRTTIHWIFIDVLFTFKSVIHFHYIFIEWHTSTPMKTLLFTMFSLAISPVVGFQLWHFSDMLIDLLGEKQKVSWHNYW